MTPTRQEARSAIEQLFADYAWAIDTRNWSLLEQVFDPDVEVAIAITGGQPFGPLHGRDNVIAALRDSVNAQTDRRRHVVTNIRLDEDASSATAVLSLLVIDAGRLETRTSGCYRARVVRDDKQFRFSSLHLTLDLPF